MVDFLDRIVADKRRRLAARAATLEPRPVVGRSTRPFAARLKHQGLSVIAEIKRRSPSKGSLRENLDPASVAVEFEVHGAAALSVLTEESFFAGSDSDLVEARAAKALPVLRKDFVIHPDQVRESRQIGADAVLLIVRLLDSALLSELIDLATEIGLDALVEVHSEAELETALDSGASLIGVNARDLETFEVDLSVALRIGKQIPEDRVAIAESGIRGPQQLRQLVDSRFDACLIGEQLMRAVSPGLELRRLIAASRGAETGEDRA